MNRLIKKPMFNHVFSKTYRVVSLATALCFAGCNNDYQEAPVPDELGTTASVEVVQKTSSTAQSGSNSSSPTRPAELSWLTVESREFGDSGVVVQLRASLDDPSRQAAVSWRQLSGPAVVIINDNALNARIIVPEVTQETELVFEITASSQGETLRAIQTVTALPLPQKVSVQNVELQPTDQVVAITLAEPVQAGARFSLSVVGGTAEEGVDYAALGTTAVSLNGTDVEVPITLLPANRDEDVYLKIAMTFSSGDTSVFTIVIPAETSQALANQTSNLLNPFEPVLAFESLDISSQQATFSLEVSLDAVVETVTLTVDGTEAAGNLVESFVEARLTATEGFLPGENIFAFNLENSQQAELLEASIFLVGGEQLQHTATRDLNIFVASFGEQTFIGNTGQNFYFVDSSSGNVDIQAEPGAVINQVFLNNVTVEDLSYFKRSNDLVLFIGEQNTELAISDWFLNPDDGDLVTFILPGGERLVIDESTIPVPDSPPLISAKLADNSGVLVDGPLVIQLEITPNQIPIETIALADATGILEYFEFPELDTTAFVVEKTFALEDFPVGETTLQFLVTDRLDQTSSQTLFVAIVDSEILGAQGQGDINVLIGGVGDDRLTAGSGINVIYGGPGNDTVDAGEGSDRIIFGVGDGQDTVIQQDIRSAGSFIDVLSLGEGIGYDNAKLLRENDDLILDINDSEDSLRMVNWYLGDATQPDFVELNGGARLTPTEFQDAFYQYWPTDMTWAYFVADPALFEGDGSDFSSPNSDISNWLTSDGPFSSELNYLFSEDLGFESAANVAWPINTVLWLHGDVDIPKGAELNIRLYVDDVTQLWVNERQWLNTSDSEGAPVLSENGTTQYLHQVTVPFSSLIEGGNRIIVRAEDFGAASYADLQVTVVIPPLAMRDRAEALANACNGVMPSDSNLPSAAARVVNPYEAAQLYIDPDFVSHITESQDEMTDARAVIAAESLKQESTGIWLDATDKLCGEPTDGRMNLLDHLILASEQAAADNPGTLSAVVFNLPARDCVSGSNPGEFGGNPAGLDGYRLFVDSITALAANFPNVRLALAVEPGALASTVENNMPTVPFSYCDEAFANDYYAQGVTHALSKFKQSANIYPYLDVGHAAWLGWPARLQDTATIVNRWLTTANRLASGDSEAPADYSLISGFTTNISEYIPLDEPFLADEDPRLLNFYRWNAEVSAHSYVAAVAEQLKANTSETLGFIIDTSRNGWGGEDRPQVVGFGDDFRLDRRQQRWQWCNNKSAGLGEFPRANPPVPLGDQGVPSYALHAYYWFKPPGKSDGNRLFNCTSDFSEALVQEPQSEAFLVIPPAGASFVEHLEQLVKNAWPPLILNSPAD